MRGIKKYSAFGLIIMFIVVLTTWISISARNTTVEGTVNDTFQVITEDDIVYEISENEKGNELVQNAGNKVRVTGEVEIDKSISETRTIIVSDFQILQDEAENVEEAEESNESFEETEESDESAEDTEESDRQTEDANDEQDN